MFLISVEWLDEAKTRARFNLPGREEWRAEHIDALMQALAQIREEMSPAVAEEPPQPAGDCSRCTTRATDRAAPVFGRHADLLPPSVARLAAVPAAEQPAPEPGAGVPGPGSRLERAPPIQLAENGRLTPPAPARRPVL